MSNLIAMQDMRRSIAAIARRAEQGEEFIVIRNSRPSFRIVPYADAGAAPPAVRLRDLTHRIDRCRAAADVTHQDVERVIRAVRKRAR
jgi:antitoxin (DNA-binding transcriptional repressor) of toxin-antitoxin stability system